MQNSVFDLTNERDKIYLANSGHAELIGAIVKIQIEHPASKDGFSQPSSSG